MVITLKRKGSGNFETVMAMVLLILFSMSIFVLMYVGKDTEKRILEQNDIKANARVASSYINVKIKQNDEINKISVKSNPATSENALVIASEENGEKIDTWIYFDDGYLFESTVLRSMAPDIQNAFPIAKIEDFFIEKQESKITTSIKYMYNGQMQKVTSIIVLRSEY